MRVCFKRLGNNQLAPAHRKISVPRFLEYASRVLEIGPKEPGTSKNDPPWAGCGGWPWEMCRLAACIGCLTALSWWWIVGAFGKTRAAVFGHEPATTYTPLVWVSARIDLSHAKIRGIEDERGEKVFAMEKVSAICVFGNLDEPRCNYGSDSRSSLYRQCADCRAVASCDNSRNCWNFFLTDPAYQSIVKRNSLCIHCGESRNIQSLNVAGEHPHVGK